MLTVGQAKEKGVIFVKGDVIEYEDIMGTLSDHNTEFANESNIPDYCPVASFTDRAHMGVEMPCDVDLPIVVNIDNVKDYDVAGAYNWSSASITSWKPDIHKLTELANKKEAKMSPQTQYTYELVKDLTPIQVIDKVLKGDEAYFANVSGSYAHLNKESSLSDFVNIHLRKEIETITRTITYPKPVSEPLNDGDEYWVIGRFEVSKEMWSDHKYDHDNLNVGCIHLTKENAQAHWDAIFGGKNG